jgi:hypothetical protein
MRLFLPVAGLIAVMFGFTDDETGNAGFFIHQQGIGPVKVFGTTIEEAKVLFKCGAEVRNTSYYGRRHGDRNPNKCYYAYVYDYELDDKALGVHIQASYRDLHVITLIGLDSNCKWKTREGIGIGSGIEDLKKAYGDKENFYESEDGGAQYGSWFFYTDKPATAPDRKIIRIVINGYFLPTYDYKEPKGPSFKPLYRMKCGRPCSKC